MKQFEASDAFKVADAEARRATAAIKSAEDVAIANLAQTPEHKSLMAALESAQKRVDFLESQGERAAAEVPAAKKDFDEAKRRLEDFEDRHVDSEPQVRAARDRLSAAEDKVNSLRDDFDKNYDQRVEVADARKAVEAGQNGYDAALRDVRDEEDRVADAQAELRKRENELALDRNRLRDADDAVRAMVDDAKDAGARADEARARYEDAVSAAECARRERQAALWAMARAEESDAFCGWNASPWGFGCYSTTVVHIRRFECDDDDFFFRRHRRFGFGFGFGPVVRPVPVWRPNPPRRVVVVQVTGGETRAARLARQHAREKARELAGRNADDEQRTQRLAAIEARREQSLQRQAQRVVKIVGDKNGVQPVGGRSDAAQRALATFPLAQATQQERANRQASRESGKDDKSARVAAARTDRDVQAGARKAFELRRNQGREQLARTTPAQGASAQAEGAAGPRGEAKTPEPWRQRRDRELAMQLRERGVPSDPNRAGQEIQAAQAERARRRVELEAARDAAEQKQQAARDQKGQLQQAARDQARQEAQQNREARQQRERDDAPDRGGQAQGQSQREQDRAAQRAQMEAARDAASQRDAAAAREAQRDYPRSSQRDAQQAAQREMARQVQAERQQSQRSADREAQRSVQRESQRQSPPPSPPPSRNDRSSNDDRAGRRNR